MPCSQAGYYDMVLSDVFMYKINRNGAYLVHTLAAWETAILLVKNFFPDGDLTKLPLVTSERNKGYLIAEAA
jgi:hypothetical protein